MLRRLWPYLKPYRGHFTAGIFCSGAEAVIELLIPLVMAEIVDVGIRSGDASHTVRMGALMIGMALVSLLFGMLSSYFSAYTGQSFGSAIRSAEYRHIQEFSFRNIEHFTTASLITRLTGDINALQMAVMMSMRLLVRAPVMLLSALVLSLLISLQLSRVFLVAIPLLVVVVGILLSRVGPLFRKMQERTDDLNLSVQEDLTSIRVVKAFVREDHETEKFSRRNQALRSTSETAFGRVVLTMPVMMLLIYGTIIAILWFGGHMVAGGTLEIGLLTTFITYVIQILTALMMISMSLMMLTRSFACARRVIEVLDEVPDIQDDTAPADDSVQSGSIRFDHVFFKYNPDNTDWDLADIDLTIHSGETVGILGGTGSGKTTLVQLIPRLYEATQGRILVDGRDVREHSLPALRDACAMVLQKNTLFSGTIRENLLWGNENASEDELWEVCRIACADEFIRQMPKGLDTDLGQGGGNLSGGQKQRLCIARALLKHPKVLILDDSTSAVDMATDARLRAGLSHALQDATKIIIAQRIASVCEADRIIVLDEGRIAAVGNHETLMQTSEIYQDVYRSQQEGGRIHG